MGVTAAVLRHYLSEKAAVLCWRHGRSCPFRGRKWSTMLFWGEYMTCILMHCVSSSHTHTTLAQIAHQTKQQYCSMLNGFLHVIFVESLALLQACVLEFCFFSFSAWQTSDYGHPFSPTIELSTPSALHHAPLTTSASPRNRAGWRKRDIDVYIVVAMPTFCRCGQWHCLASRLLSSTVLSAHNQNNYILCTNIFCMNLS